MSYTRIFKPRNLEDHRSDADREAPQQGDRRDGKVYRYTPDIILRVNLALATGRPLLVRGTSGVGKSSLALNAARVLKRRCYEFVVTSRSRAGDLHHTFDAVRRLGDAQARVAEESNDSGFAPLDVHKYIEPGPLWWMLDRDTAQYRGRSKDELDPRQRSEYSAEDPCIFEPPRPTAKTGAVLLIDEIDKADPDVPNGLLVPLGSGQFRVPELGRRFPGSAAEDPSTDAKPGAGPLVVITTNQERELPPAFLRRCITLDLPDPDAERLEAIALDVFGEAARATVESVLTAYGTADSGQDHANVAEFLDAVAAARVLKAKGQGTFEEFIRATTDKATGAPG